jgi:hypothetical protein
MAIPTSKPLAMSTVQTEYGGSNPISLSEYYSLGNAPASGEITLWADFNGTSNIVTATSVNQIYNWYGNSTYSTEDTSQSADMVNAGIKIQPSTTSYTLYSYIDAGEPWLGKVITGYSNLRIETKIEVKRDSDGHPVLNPPQVLAGSSVNYYAEDLSGTVVATLGVDDHEAIFSGSGTETRTAIDNAAITGAMTDAEIKAWLSAGCPLRHRYFDETETDGGNTASVDTPEVYTVSLLADSISYIP